MGLMVPWLNRMMQAGERHGEEEELSQAKA